MAQGGEVRDQGQEITLIHTCEGLEPQGLCAERCMPHALGS